MLKVQYTKHFLKQYKKLPKSLQEKARQALQKFVSNPKDQSLKPHKLTGELKNFYAISIDYKTRIVFEINKTSQAIILLKVGNHDIYR